MIWNVVIVVHIFAWSNDPNDSYRDGTHQKKNQQNRSANEKLILYEIEG